MLFSIDFCEIWTFTQPKIPIKMLLSFRFFAVIQLLKIFAKSVLLSVALDYVLLKKYYQADTFYSFFLVGKFLLLSSGVTLGLGSIPKYFLFKTLAKGLGQTS